MRLNGKISELVGAIIGDGNLWSDGRHYRVELTRDPDLDAEYFQYLSKNIRDKLSENPKTRTRQREIRIRICSKKLFYYSSNDSGIHVGSGKAVNVKIPKDITQSSWKVKSKCLRGIMGTDGSFFLSEKGYLKDYPTIEIISTSQNLTTQIKNILENKKFRVGFRNWVPKEERNTKYIVSINGSKMCKKWVEKIGFSNSRHYRKINKI